MRAIAGRTRTVDSLRVAVLAALNIADEYHQVKAKYEETTQRVDEKVEECSRMTRPVPEGSGLNQGMRILFIGDVFGQPGRRIVKEMLPALLGEYDPDWCWPMAKMLPAVLASRLHLLKSYSTWGLPF